MKKKLLIAIAVFLMAPSAVNAQTKVQPHSQIHPNFSGDWEANPEVGFTSVHLVQKGTVLRGNYSTSPYPNLKKIQGGDLRGTIVGNHARLTFTSGFAVEKSKGVALLTLTGNKLLWKTLSNPKAAAGEDYSPSRESLVKVDMKKLEAISKQVYAGRDLADDDGDPAEVEKLMRPVFTLRPRDFKAETTYANALIDLNRIDEAIKILKDVSDNDPSDSADLFLISAYLKKQNYAEAEKLCQSALDNNPGSSSIWMALSDAQRHLGKKDAALASAQKSVDANSENRTAWINLGDIAMFAAQFDRAASAYQSALDLGSLTDDSAKIQALMENCLAEAGNKQKAGADKDNYANIEPTQARWKASDMPLKIYIASTSKIKTFRPEFIDILKDSFDQWSKASEGRLKFVYVNSKYLANITCDFTENRKDVNTEADGANTDIVIADSSPLWSNMLILTSLSDAGTPVDDATMRHTCLHEIGHAIGLLKHSPEPKDVMFAFMEDGTLARRLSRRDVLTIQKLYSDVAPVAAAADAAAVAKPRNAADKP